MKQVTEEEYYNFLLDKDIILELKGEYPYVSVWKYRHSHEVVARRYPKDKTGYNYKFYIKQ